MRKLNNKGFAISTLIYGLAIMGIMIVAILMATMDQTRSNNTNLAKSIEEELNRFSKLETSFNSTDGDVPTAQEYIVPESGWYRVELWGSQGTGSGGYGAYTSGIIELEEGDILYFYVGKHGGKETDVRITSGGYSDYQSYQTRIMVAAGGGSTSTAWGGTLYGYNSNMDAVGGFIKSQGNDRDFSLIPADDSSNTTNGTLIGLPKTYALSSVRQPAVGNIILSPNGANGGGDGFVPSNTSTTGGASFIAGYAGSVGVSKGILTESPIYEHYEYDYNPDTETSEYDDSKHGVYYFVDGLMLPGVKDGDGFARIKRILKKQSSNETLKKKNTKLNNVRYIKDCVSSDTETEDKVWQQIVAISEGLSISSGKELEESSDNCRIIDLGSTYNLDEIAVFHNPNAGIDYNDNIITVSNDKSNWITIKGQGAETDLSETETETGIRISAYQYDITNKLPGSGTYLIIPVLSLNKVVSASETASNPILIEQYKGQKRQKVKIEILEEQAISSIGSSEYSIVEQARQKALSTSANTVGNTLTATNKFSKNARTESQIWKIEPVGNGTYTIRTAISPYGASGMIIAQTNQSVNTAKNQIIISNNNKETARFKIYSIEY